MELAEWAETLVFGSSLDHKLTPLTRSTDLLRGQAIIAPSAPGRPKSLSFDRLAPKVALPSVHQLHDDRAKAQILHHFANHELLAIELMALTLLRFPNEDADFRRTLAVTIRDEQRHLSQYIDRMAELGLTLGSVPVSQFFWDCLAQAPTAASFMAGMSLTLEQANLDFLQTWSRGFALVGDEHTVDLLQRVHRDEIRHVRHGAQWLANWTPDTPDLFEAWTQHLRSPLTPRRARGPEFDEAARLRAGLPADFIARVRTAAHSKGRPPRVFHFNPWVEFEHANAHFRPNRVVSELAGDLAPTLAVLASEDDVVLVSQPPPTDHLRALAERGWPLPEYVSADDPAALGQRAMSRVVPWGWSARNQRWATPPDAVDGGVVAALAGKDLASRVLATLPDDPRLDLEAGTSCASLAEVEASLAGPGEHVVKARWSTAGRGLIRVDDGLSEPQRRRIVTWIRTQGAVVVEPWRRRVLDLSLQAEVRDSGLKRIVLTRFLTTPGGQFTGVALGPWQRSLPIALRRFIGGEGRQPRFVIETLTSALRAVLDTAPNYRGPIGIDALITDRGSRYQLRPLVEVNPRYSFGRIGHEVGRRLLASGSTGVWMHISKTRAARAGFSSFCDLQAHLTTTHPPVGTPLRHGVVATTSAAQAQQMWTVLVASPTIEEALAILP